MIGVSHGALVSGIEACIARSLARSRRRELPLSACRCVLLGILRNTRLRFNRSPLSVDFYFLFFSLFFGEPRITRDARL